MADLEFPRLVHKGTDKRRVESKAEFDTAVKDGFKEHADPPAESPAAQGKTAEKTAEKTDEDTPEKRGPGRPSKT